MSMNAELQSFYDRYRIFEFYEQLSQTSDHPIRPFRPERHRSLSYGIIPGYRRYDLFYERYLSAVRFFKQVGAIRDGMKVLDVGSGEGFFKFFFDALCPEHITWHGIETWKERIEFCRHIGYHVFEVNLEQGRFTMDNDTYDIVLASHVLEHLPNPRQILMEMGRVLKPGGLLLVATPTKPPIVAEVDAWLHRRARRGTGDTQQAFTHRSLQHLILDSLRWPASAVVDKRGFRIFSSRKKLPLENWKWFHNLSTWLGRKWLFLVPEVNIILKKEKGGSV
jgi:SAM-dependent methyltransferase